MDSDKTKDYCNYAIKKGLKEDIDYKYISHKVWIIFNNKYGGDNIKRYVSSLNDEKNLTFIETWLK